MDKCNFVNHDLCRGGWVNADLEKMCIAVEQPCPHKALTPAEKVPRCPKCGHSTHNQGDCVRCTCNEQKPSPVKEPVVRETTFVCPRCGDEMTQDYELCGDPWVCSKCDFPCGNARKPAKPEPDPKRCDGCVKWGTDHPGCLSCVDGSQKMTAKAKPAIEPVAEVSYQALHDKIQELVARNNDLYKRVNALEGK